MKGAKDFNLSENGFQTLNKSFCSKYKILKTNTDVGYIKLPTAKHNRTKNGYFYQNIRTLYLWVECKGNILCFCKYYVSME